jgi:hypothetical protein
MRMRKALGGGGKEAKPKQRTDGRDDFFEEDGTGSESPEGWEPATHTQPAEVPSKRRTDKFANHASQHSKPPDRHLTKVKTKHQKNRESTTATDWQGYVWVIRSLAQAGPSARVSGLSPCVYYSTSVAGSTSRGCITYMFFCCVPCCYPELE